MGAQNVLFERCFAVCPEHTDCSVLASLRSCSAPLQSPHLVVRGLADRVTASLVLPRIHKLPARDGAGEAGLLVSLGLEHLNVRLVAAIHTCERREHIHAYVCARAGGSVLRTLHSLRAHRHPHGRSALLTCQGRPSSSCPSSCPSTCPRPAVSQCRSTACAAATRGNRWGRAW